MTEVSNEVFQKVVTEQFALFETLEAELASQEEEKVESDPKDPVQPAAIQSDPKIEDSKIIAKKPRASKK
jgi:hypothetical protein